MRSVWIALIALNALTLAANFHFGLVLGVACSALGLGYSVRGFLAAMGDR